MSGIVGIYHPDGKPVTTEKLGLMLDAIAHRGSDGANFWHQDNVGLGHRMLWTTPESLLERLPWCDRATDTGITADARIDNRDELISLLDLKHLPAEKITDSTLILKAYHKWGIDCPQKLLGDFAFAIWDGKQQQLFCARDPMGIKPFYYYYSSNVFIFGSEIKTLFFHSAVPKHLNELKVGYYLQRFCDEQSETFYKDIYRLPAASYLVVNPKSKKINSYWSLDPKQELRFNSEREYIETFREIFTEAVSCRLRSAFPVGSSLSGGLDSSSIACTARLLLANTSKQLHTFSAIFPNLPAKDLPIIDERGYMETVTSLGGFIPHQIRADLLNPLLDLLWQDEEPILAPNQYIHQGMYECANQNGVRVFLDGIDGDSTVSHGWTYLTELAISGRWLTLKREVNAAARRCRLSRKLILRTYVAEPLFFRPLTYLWQKACGEEDLHHELIDSDFARKIELTKWMHRDTNSEPGLTLDSRKIHAVGLMSGLYPHVMAITDKFSSQFSLEARYPFFDRRLMEFCVAIPTSQKFNQGWTRAILRSAMKDILPLEVGQRVTKARLGANFRRNFLEKAGETIKQTIEQKEVLQAYVSLPYLDRAYQRYSSKIQAQDDDDLNIFACTVIAKWIQQSGFV